MTRYSGQDQPARVQPPARPVAAPEPPPPPSGVRPFGIIEATGDISEAEMRRIRDAFAAAQGRPASAYPIAPYEVTIERPRRSWWRRLLNLPVTSGSGARW